MLPNPLMPQQNNQEDFFAQWKNLKKTIPNFNLISQRGKYQCEIDPNILSVNMSELMRTNEISTGDPVQCQSCLSYLNSYSILSKKQESLFEWNCEYCGQQNELNLEEEEIPQSELTTYVLQGSQQMRVEKQKLDDISILFVIDTSGSMGVTQPITQKIKLRVDPQEELKKQFQGTEFWQQMLEEEKRQNFTYISRLQCVQAAIDQQIEKMVNNCPTRHVGLITFSSEVQIIGDGTQDPQQIMNDSLNSLEEMKFIVKDSHQKWLGSQIQACHKDLIDKLWNLKECGQTALGPALIVAIELASQGRCGSKIIICTDGIANVGLGQLENQIEDQFYTECANQAKQKGIEISIISIEGQECKLDQLFPLIQQTQGQITKVDPTQLHKNFQNILQNPVIATNVKLTVTLHNQLKFRKEEDLQLDGSRVRKDIGNVNANSIITFEFMQKPSKETKYEKASKQVSNFPFQVAIEYTTLDDMKCLGILTKQKESTNESEKAEENLNIEVIANNAKSKSAQKAQEGDYRGAQAESLA